jgi:hypothetical protein
MLSFIMLRSSLLFLVILSCSTPKQENQEETGILTRFDQRFIKHFPTNKNYLILQETLFYPEFDKGFYESPEFLNTGAFAIRTYGLSDRELDQLFNSLNLNEIDPVKHSNSDCFPCHRKKAGRPTECNGLKTPTPTFSNERDLFKIDGEYLTDDFDLYIIDAEPGNFLPPKNLIKTECVNSKWNHGYSIGVALNRKLKVAIFWTELW